MFIGELLSWLEHIVSSIPGKVGNKIRRYWLSRKLNRQCRVSIASGVEFVSPANMSFGNGIAIGKNSYFSADGGKLIIKSDTSFNMNVHINASIGGTISIGESCLIGPNVVMRTAGHIYNNPKLLIKEQGHIIKDICIDDDVWVGANAVILGGVHIGCGAVVAAGSIVTKDVPSMSVVAGVPANIIKYRGEISK